MSRDQKPGPILAVTETKGGAYSKCHMTIGFCVNLVMTHCFLWYNHHGADQLMYRSSDS